MYTASAPVFLRMLGNRDQLLVKAEENAEQRGFDPDLLVIQRLAPDSAKMARLSGGTPPSMPDTEATMADLHARIAQTIDYVKSVPASAIDGSEEKDILLKTPSGDYPFKGLGFLTGFALPNLLFHVSIAYAILRHNGAPLGKLDFLGSG